jgi:hypothetical protein
MRTCSAPTPRERLDGRLARERLPRPATSGPSGERRRAFVLVELIVVISLLALLLLVAQVNLFGMLRRSTFKARVQDFIATMQMAAASAAESPRRYEVIIDLAEQSYLLRQITTSDLDDVRDEEIVTQGSFGSNCQVSYVEFDDGDATNRDRAKFRAGHAGWVYGGKIVFLDDAEQPYAVVVSRLHPIVQLVQGDPPLMTPKTKEEVPSL